MFSALRLPPVPQSLLFRNYNIRCLDTSYQIERPNDDFQLPCTVLFSLTALAARCVRRGRWRSNTSLTEFVHCQAGSSQTNIRSSKSLLSRWSTQASQHIPSATPDCRWGDRIQSSKSLPSRWSTQAVDKSPVKPDRIRSSLPSRWSTQASQHIPRPTPDRRWGGDRRPVKPDRKTVSIDPSYQKTCQVSALPQIYAPVAA
jgi:hypothetical protein